VARGRVWVVVAVLLIGDLVQSKSRLVETLEGTRPQMVEGEVDAGDRAATPRICKISGLYPAINFYERALAIDREELARSSV